MTKGTKVNARRLKMTQGVGDTRAIEFRDECGNLIASTESHHQPVSVEDMVERRIAEGHIRDAGQADTGSVQRFIEHLERSADSEGVHIDAEDCAGFARDLRAAIGTPLDPKVVSNFEWAVENRDFWGRCCVDDEDLIAVIKAAALSKARGQSPIQGGGR